MKSTLNNTCLSALLCGAVLIAIPAVAADVGGGVGASATTGAANASAGTGVNTAGTSAGAINNNAASNAGAATAAPAPGTASNTWRNNSVGGSTVSSDLNTSATGKVDTAAQTPAQQMEHKAHTNAAAAEADATRQLNQQAAVNTNPAAGAVVQ